MTGRPTQRLDKIKIKFLHVSNNNNFGHCVPHNVSCDRSGHPPTSTHHSSIILGGECFRVCFPLFSFRKDVTHLIFGKRLTKVSRTELKSETSDYHYSTTTPRDTSPRLQQAAFERTTGAGRLVSRPPSTTSLSLEKVRWELVLLPLPRLLPNVPCTYDFFLFASPLPFT